MSHSNKRAVSGQTQTGATKQSLRVWLKMLKASKHIEALVRERLRQEFDTTLPRFDVMAALYRYEGGLKMSELSAALRVSNGNVTGIIERLVADGAVLRAPVTGDRRAMQVCLTQKGREEFSAMAAAHEGWINEIMGVLSMDQSIQLLAIMDAIEHSHALHDEPGS